MKKKKRSDGFFGAKKFINGKSNKSKIEYKPGKGKGFRFMTSTEDNNPEFFSITGNNSRLQDISSQGDSSYLYIDAPEINYQMLNFNEALDDLNQDQEIKSQRKHLQYAKEVNNNNECWETNYEYMKQEYNLRE